MAISLKRPGVFLEEKPALAIPPAGTIGASTGAFVGAHNRGPTTATLVESYSEFTTLFGDVVGATSELPFQVYSFFANGGSTAYVCRVAGVGAAAATRTLMDRAGTPAATLDVNAKNPGAWGNQIYVDVIDTPVAAGAAATGTFDLTVKYGGTTDAFMVERFTGLTMLATNERYAPTIINNAQTGSRYISVALPATPSAAASPLNNPSVISNRQLTSGADGTAAAAGNYSTALQTFDTILEPFNLVMPGASTTFQNLGLSYAQDRGDVFMLCELPSTAITTTALAITAAQALTATSYGAVYWPNIVAANPASSQPGATRVQAPTGAIAGLLALTDATRGIQKAPAGTGARVAGALSPEYQLTAANLDDLNVAQVNAVRQIPGSGTVVMGARTLKAGASDRYIPIRRSLIYVKANVIALSQFAVFEPNTTQTRRAVEDVISSFLNDCWTRGVLKGASPDQAYFVVCDDSNNSATSVSQGIINVEVGVSLVTPAEFIVIKIGQFEGGASASES